jgi:hypothetical protein
MRRGYNHRSANNSKFFQRELEELIKLDNILLEAYILVNKGYFTYADVKSMTRAERTLFIKFLKDDLERQEDAIKRNRSS